MKYYLTSSIGASYKENGIRIPCALDSSNGFVEHLKNNWPDVPKCLIMNSEPENEEMNDGFKNIYDKSLLESNNP